MSVLVLNAFPGSALWEEIQAGWPGRTVYLLVPLEKIPQKGFLNTKTLELFLDQPDDYPRGVRRMANQIFFDRFKVRKFEFPGRELRLTLSRPAYYGEDAFRDRVDVVIRLMWKSAPDHRRLNDTLASVIVPEESLPQMLRINGDGPKLVGSLLMDAAIAAAVTKAQQTATSPELLFGAAETCLKLRFGGDSLTHCWWEDYQVLGIYREERLIRLLYIQY